MSLESVHILPIGKFHKAGATFDEITYDFIGGPF